MRCGLLLTVGLQLSWFNTRESTRKADRDFERRGSYGYDRDLYNDHLSEDGRAYREQFQERVRQHEEEERRAEQREQQRQREEAEERRQERLREQWAEEQRERERMEQEQEEPPPPDPDPMVEAIEQAVAEYQQNLAENAP